MIQNATINIHHSRSKIVQAMIFLSISLAMCGFIGGMFLYMFFTTPTEHPLAAVILGLMFLIGSLALLIFLRFT